MKFEMEMDNLRKKWAYLSDSDSARYDEVKDSTDPKDIEIKELLERLARKCRAEHCASRY